MLFHIKFFRIHKWTIVSQVNSMNMNESQFNVKSHHAYSKSSKFLPVQIDISERPFQVVFLYDGSFRCSGAWMGDKNILTSSVCCDEVM